MCSEILRSNLAYRTLSVKYAKNTTIEGVILKNNSVTYHPKLSWLPIVQTDLQEMENRFVDKVWLVRWAGYKKWRWKAVHNVILKKKLQLSFTKLIYQFNY